MKLRKFKKIIDDTLKNAGECDPKVEFYIDDVRYRIEEVSQFEILPNVVITLTEDTEAKESDLKHEEDDRRYVEMKYDLNRKIDALENRIEVLEQRRKSIIPKYLIYCTGEIDESILFR